MTKVRDVLLNIFRMLCDLIGDFRRQIDALIMLLTLCRNELLVHATPVCYHYQNL